MSVSVNKKNFHLKADNEQEATNGRLSCFVDVSRSGIQLLKLNEEFKVVEFIYWSFSPSSTNAVWSKRVNEVIQEKEFIDAIAENPYKFSVSDNQAVVIPEALFSESEKEKYFDFLLVENQVSEIAGQKLSNTDAIGLFRVPKALHEIIRKPIASSFLTWTDSILGNSSGVKAYLVLQEKQFSLTIVKEGRLQFSNWFWHAKPEDVLYFLMATLESLDILHSDVELELGGNIEKGDVTFNMISRFIAKISFLKRPTSLNYSYSFNNIPEHRFPFILAAACA